MNPTTSPALAPFRRYTTALGMMNVLCAIGAVLCFVGAIIFFCASYLFNDSGNVPQAVAPLARILFLDSLACAILFIWQLKVRKHLFAMQPSARTSMIALGVAYVVIALINVSQMWIFAIPLAAIGIWWIVAFSRSSTRSAFEAVPLPVSET